ncbi:uncharacterized protein NPIL_394171 [Nephila pilipes]|uniref:Methyltransferase type 11 domain-containing protein n=1 Tax=Nephila pilipes TaxID=299642 RepID=A0A8X6TQ23_NEPPI|nr:uncharacterized protein NPIL_394171 [Nephila pilipes]
MDIGTEEWNEFLPKANEFILQCMWKLKWKNLSKDVVMDLRFGMYFSCSRAILEQYPDVGCVIALDNPYIIRDRSFSDKRFEKHINNEKITFSSASIETRISLEAYAGKIDKIVSWNAFQQIHRKERALENVYHMLKPGGHVGMWFYLNNPEYSWPWKMKSTGKWDQYQQTDPLLPYHPGTSDTKYEEMMQEIDFKMTSKILVQSKPILYRDDREV